MQDSTVPDTTISHRNGHWVEVMDWPSADVVGQTFWLNASGLGRAADQGGGTLTICSPQSYGAAGGDMTSFATPGDMPGDQRVDAGGALIFRSAPLDAQMNILGQPKLRLRVTADRPQGFVTALLTDEAPDGAQSLITRGFFNLTHRISSEVVTPVVAGEAMEVTVALHGMAWQVPEGHRLVLHLASTYWPILWPSPEPVTLGLRPGISVIEIPTLVSDEAVPCPRVLAPPPSAALRQTTQLCEGSMTRDIVTDLISGKVRHRMFIDGGVFGPIGKIRFDAIGTEFHDVSERIYEIHPDDPLSAKATMTQSRTMERGDWQVRIETYSEMTASSDAFHLTAHVECWEGDVPFHRVDWSHEIPRNGM
jgi:hypothetical protein